MKESLLFTGYFRCLLRQVDFSKSKCKKNYYIQFFKEDRKTENLWMLHWLLRTRVMTCQVDWQEEGCRAANIYRIAVCVMWHGLQEWGLESGAVVNQWTFLKTHQPSCSAPCLLQPALTVQANLFMITDTGWAIRTDTLPTL